MWNKYFLPIVGFVVCSGVFVLKLVKCIKIGKAGYGLVETSKLKKAWWQEVCIVGMRACVLVADEDTFFQGNCRNFLTQHKVRTICLERDGKKVLDAIKNNHPNVVVMNAIMPFFDSASVMHIAKEFNFARPQFIVVSEVDDVELKRENITVGASAFVLKPFDNSLLLSKILYMISYAKSSAQKHLFEIAPIVPKEAARVELPRRECEQLISKALLSFGISPHISGYRYLRDAIMFVWEHFSCKISITKDVYVFVAQAQHSTPSRVERSIRHAISSTWPTISKILENKLMPVGFLMRPTNSQFIFYIVHELQASIQKVG
ncbi:MAG: response regulator [Oscillospiraceae bacterium]|nr:response regulator [Oscillospiraceae bacterium]